MRDLLTPAGQPARVSDKAADALLAMGWKEPVAGGAAAAGKPKRKAPAKKKTASKKKSTKAGD